jgi:hypothetical protein
VPGFQQRLPQSCLANLPGTDDKGHATLAKVILQEQVFEAPLHTTNFQYPGRKSRPMTRWLEESHVAGDIALPRNFEGEGKRSCRSAVRSLATTTLWLAAHVRAEGWILVTNNTREFSRVPGLQLENWARNLTGAPSGR